MHNLEKLEVLENYRAHFMDVEFFSPYIHQIWLNSSFGPIGHINPGLAGTFPTFIVDNFRVIKFFGRLFSGLQSFEVERVCTLLAQDHCPFPVPNILGQGEIFPTSETPWAYLVYEYIPGISIGQVLDDFTFQDSIQLAKWLGKVVRSLHHIPIAKEVGLNLPHQAVILGENRLYCQTRHQEWKSLPGHLTDQIELYLLSTDYLSTHDAPSHLIHADLTRDHLLGEFGPDGWVTRAIIDFGDAMLGRLDYELVALHLDLFKGDKRLLLAFLDSYGYDPALSKTLAIQAMRATLLFNFDILQVLPVLRPDKTWPTIEALAEDLWDTTVVP